MSVSRSNSANSASSANSPVPVGVIAPQELYTRSEALRRLGWTDSAYRAARRRGLRVIKSGKRHYLIDAEIIHFLTAGGDAA